jgi:inorganic pyrophosphatase
LEDEEELVEKIEVVNFGTQVDLYKQQIDALNHIHQSDLDKKNQTISEFERVVRQLTVQCDTQTGKNSDFSLKVGELQIKLNQSDTHIE